LYRSAGEFPRLVIVLVRLLFTPAASAMLETSFSAGPWIKPARKSRMKTKRLSAFMILYLNKGVWRDEALVRAVDAWLYGSLDDLEREIERALAPPPPPLPPAAGIVDAILDEDGPEDEDFDD
jgi:hypothetical protein